MNVAASHIFEGVILTLCLSIASASATEPFATINSPIYSAMSYPTGERNLGLGATGTADFDRNLTGFYNPACLAWARGATVVAGHQNWYRGHSNLSTHLSGGLHVGGDDANESHWCAGGSLGYTALSYEPPVPQPTPFLPAGTVTTSNQNDYYLSATAAAGWEDGLVSAGVGGTAKYLRDEIIDEVGTAWAFDLGIVAAMTWTFDNNARLRARGGASVSNLSTGLSLSWGDSDLVGAYRAGIGGDAASPTATVFHRDVPLAALSLDYDRIYPTHVSGDRDGWAFGVELDMASFVQVRWGRGRNINPALAPGKSTTAGAGIGWAIGRWSAQFDFAYISTTPETIYLAEWDETGFSLALGATF